jgi:hypothetical protein
MKLTRQILILSILLFFNSCITQFIPQTTEDKQLLVVEGLITDQPGVNTIKLSRSNPLGTRTVGAPVKGSTVSISDDLGNTFSLTETVPGTYVTNPAIFQGAIGRQYTLHINTNNSITNHTYESYPAEIKPVPPIDSVYYEKVTISENNGVASQQGCQIYLNTYDPTNQCKYYRWEYIETWKIVLPYYVTNNTCWVTDYSDLINIKNTSVLEEDKIDRYPINFISNLTDRLSVKYSILVNQYSLSEDEYNYWEKLQNFSEQVGGLYDLIPSSVPSNIYCTDDPSETVLGYFSVSANSSKRIFIKDQFAGLVNQYANCAADTIYGNAPIQNLNNTVWVIVTVSMPPPPYRVITYTKGCADCTVRGTTVEPDFWIDDK